MILLIINEDTMLKLQTNRDSTPKLSNGSELIISNVLQAISIMRPGPVKPWPEGYINFLLTYKSRAGYNNACYLAYTFLQKTGYVCEFMGREIPDSEITSHLNKLSQEELDVGLKETCKYIIGQAILHHDPTFRALLRELKKGFFDLLSPQTQMNILHRFSQDTKATSFGQALITEGGKTVNLDTSGSEICSMLLAFIWHFGNMILSAYIEEDFGVHPVITMLTVASALALCSYIMNKSNAPEISLWFAFASFITALPGVIFSGLLMGERFGVNGYISSAIILGTLGWCLYLISKNPQSPDLINFANAMESFLAISTIHCIPQQNQKNTKTTYINMLENQPKAHNTWPSYLDDIRFNRELAIGAAI